MPTVGSEHAPPSQDENELRAWLREHVLPPIAELAGALDAGDADPGEVRMLFARTGVYELVVPVNDPSSAWTAAVCVEEVATVCGGCALLLMVQRLAALPVALAGSDVQRTRLLSAMAAGEITGAFALTEPGAGSDAAALATRAVPDGDDWVISGRKVWISNAPDADFLVVFAVTDPESGGRGITAFLVDTDAPGVEIAPPDAKIGVRATPTAAITFNDVRVPHHDVLGAPGGGLKIALRTLDSSRLGVAAQATGLAQGAIDAAVAHGQTRHQFGGPLLRQQGFAFPLARLAAQTIAGRELLRAACARADAGDGDAGHYAAMAKLVCSENAVAATQAAIHALGATGYVQGGAVERLARDARVTTIYEGTSEVQLMLIARQLSA